MTTITYTVKDSGSSVTNTVNAIISAPSAGWMPGKCGPIVWSGSTAEFGFPLNSGGFGRWLGSTALASIKAQGFDMLRMTFEAGVLMTQGASQQQAGIANYVAGVKSLVAAGLQVIATPNADCGGFTGKTVFDSLTGPNWTKLKAVNVQVAQQLAALAANVAFELPCNEPQSGLPVAQFYAFVNDMRTAVRAVAPATALLIAGDNLQSPDSLQGYDATMWPASDKNLWATFHYYGEPQGQQGLNDPYHKWLNRIPIPPPADLNTRLAELTAQQNAYVARLSAAGQNIANHQSEVSAINWYYGNNQPWSSTNVPRDQAWVNNYFAGIGKWASGIGIPGKVIFDEGGCTGDNTLTGIVVQGADRQSRINGYIMVGTAAKANGFSWCPQQLFGANGTQGQGLVTNDVNLTWDLPMAAACATQAGWLAR